MKVSELTGAQLDYWVAKAEGLSPFFDAVIDDELYAAWQGRCDPYHPSKDWAQGGPIIERERIDVIRDYLCENWAAYVGPLAMVRTNASGPTPLIAAMRAYVASKYGEEVPDEVQSGIKST